MMLYRVNADGKYWSLWADLESAIAYASYLMSTPDYDNVEVVGVDDGVVYYGQEWMDYEIIACGGYNSTQTGL